MQRFLILFLLFNFTGFGQSPAFDYFEMAGRMHRSGQTKIALRYFEKALQLCDTSKSICDRSLFNIGYIHYEQKDYDTALLVFSTILESKVNDLDPNGLMEVYTNYKHRSCIYLSEIWEAKNNIKKALYWFSMADTAYPYQHFCGNELSADKIYTACRYADLYEYSNNTKLIIKTLLPCIFIELADNSEIIERLSTLFKKENPENIKYEFIDAVNNMYKKTQTGNYGAYREYYIKFRGAEIYVPGSYDYLKNEAEFDRKAAIEEIYLSDFYKMLSGLH